MSDIFTPLGSEDSQEQSQTDSSSGTDETSVEQLPPKEETQSSQEAQTPASVEGQTGTQSKQDRHADKKIQQLSDSRLKVARLAVEASPESIAVLYEQDKDLATQVFSEYEFPKEDIEEYIHSINNPDEDFKAIQRQTQNDNELAQVKEQLLQMKMDSLRSTNPDLKDDVQEEFIRLTQSKAFPDKTDVEILNIARIAVGKEVKPLDASTLLDVKQAELAASSNNKGGGSSEGKAKLDKEFLSKYFSPEMIEKTEKRNNK